MVNIAELAAGARVVVKPVDRETCKELVAALDGAFSHIPRFREYVSQDGTNFAVAPSQKYTGCVDVPGEECRWTDSCFFLTYEAPIRNTELTRSHSRPIDMGQSGKATLFAEIKHEGCTVGVYIAEEGWEQLLLKEPLNEL